MSIDVQDLDRLVKFTKQEHIDLVVVGPENPLAVGIVTILKKRAFPFLGLEKAVHKLRQVKYSRKT